jgi:putative protein kinase ArgK-like GTPase of G3E family
MEKAFFGITGEKGVGKDTFADELVVQHKGLKKSFAENLKKCCKEMFLLTDAQLNDPALKEQPDARWFGASPRQMLQYVGTELFRNQLETIMPGIGNTVHLHAFELWYQENKNQNVVIADVRFLNEAELIKRHGGIIIKIVRDNNNIYSSGDKHASEQEQKRIVPDITFHNNGTKEDLKLYVENLPNLLNSLSAQKKREINCESEGRRKKVKVNIEDEEFESEQVGVADC